MYQENDWPTNVIVLGLSLFKSLKNETVTESF